MNDVGSRIPAKCFPVHAGQLSMLRETAEIFLREVPVWKLTPNATAITREFRARSYAQGARLVEDIRTLAEQQDHRPTLVLTFEGHLTVTLTTLSAHGITLNDFVMAKLIERILFPIRLP